MLACLPALCIDTCVCCLRDCRLAKLLRANLSAAHEHQAQHAASAGGLPQLQRLLVHADGAVWYRAAVDDPLAAGLAAEAAAVIRRKCSVEGASPSFMQAVLQALLAEAGLSTTGATPAAELLMLCALLFCRCCCRNCCCCC